MDSFAMVEGDSTGSKSTDGNDAIDQSRMPFLESLIIEKAKQKISFHMPGHKGTCSPHPKLIELLGGDPHPADLVELNYNIDYLHAPRGALVEAQALAAAAYGADHTYFLINGSTVGNIAAIMSVTSPGQKIIVSRASHRSVYTGLILSGATPIYIEPDYHPEIHFPLAVSTEAVKELLEQHADITAIHITSPNYYGVMSNIAAIRELTRQRGIPLLVDEAHGSHLRFHPDLPISAVSLRADIIIQSTHKTQGALTQASMLHVNDNGLINLSRIGQNLSLLQSTSPSSILLASLDAARSQMATEGYQKLTHVIQLAQEARQSIRQIKHLWCYGDDLIGVGGISSFDPTKLVIRVCDTGYTGLEAFDFLQAKHRIDAEFADLKHLICSISLVDNRTTIDQLLDALRDLSKESHEIKEAKNAFIEPPKGLPSMMMTPRNAYFAVKTYTIPIHQSVGEILTETVIPYPPGVPLLVPGEIVEQRHVDYISYLIRKGRDFIGTEDSSMNTLRIIRK